MPKGIKGFQQNNKGGKGKTKIPQDVKELFKAHLPRAVERLIELSECTNRPVAIRATEVLIAYAIGKPVQPIANDNEKPFVIKVDTTNQSPYELHKQDHS